jgi:GxxExxY protein
LLRVQSPLSKDVEKLVYDTIGCCLTVHRELGPGLLEILYSKATAIELRNGGIPFEREKAFPVSYRGELLCEQRLDFVVGSKLILEIKAVDLIANVHHQQLLHYMRLSRMPVGLLINFNVAYLRDGIVRKVL